MKYSGVYLELVSVEEEAPAPDPRQSRAEHQALEVDRGLGGEHGGGQQPRHEVQLLVRRRAAEQAVAAAAVWTLGIRRNLCLDKCDFV